MPLTCGTWHPAIRIPASANTYVGPRLRAVPLHDLAHVTAWVTPRDLHGRARPCGLRTGARCVRRGSPPSPGGRVSAVAGTPSSSSTSIRRIAVTVQHGLSAPARPRTRGSSSSSRRRSMKRCRPCGSGLSRRREKSSTGCGQGREEHRIRRSRASVVLDRSHLRRPSTTPQIFPGPGTPFRSPGLGKAARDPKGDHPCGGTTTHAFPGPRRHS